jgi:hypothetical protein
VGTPRFANLATPRVCSLCGHRADVCFLALDALANEPSQFCKRFKIEVDHRRGVEREQLAERQPAHYGVAKRLVHFRVGAVTERYAGEHGGRRSHHDRTEAQQAGLSNRQAADTRYQSEQEAAGAQAAKENRRRPGPRGQMKGNQTVLIGKPRPSLAPYPLTLAPGPAPVAERGWSMLLPTNRRAKPASLFRAIVFGCAAKEERAAPVRRRGRAMAQSQFLDLREIVRSPVETRHDTASCCSPQLAGSRRGSLGASRDFRQPAHPAESPRPSRNWRSRSPRC